MLIGEKFDIPQSDCVLCGVPTNVMFEGLHTCHACVAEHGNFLRELRHIQWNVQVARARITPPGKMCQYCQNVRPVTDEKPEKRCV